MLHHIGDIYSLCKETCNPKYLSVLLYMSCRHVGLSWRQSDNFLTNIGAMSIVSSHYHSQTFLNENLSDFTSDGRGGKRGSDFWDEYSELEIMARQFAVESCNRKSANLTVQELAKYVDEKFYELTGLTKSDDHFVRTIESCRLDLRKWGIRYGSNKTRPYFLGHERFDVVEHRESFIKYFLSREDSYYRISEGESLSWIISTSSFPVILMCKLKIRLFVVSKPFSPSFHLAHDELTFRSNEISAK